MHCFHNVLAAGAGLHFSWRGIKHLLQRKHIYFLGGWSISCFVHRQRLVVFLMKGTLALKVPRPYAILLKCPHFAIGLWLSVADIAPRPLGRGLLLVGWTHQYVIWSSGLNCGSSCIHEFVTLIRVANVVAIQSLISVRLLSPPFRYSFLYRFIFLRNIPNALYLFAGIDFIQVCGVLFMNNSLINNTLTLCRAASELIRTFTSKINLMRHLFSNLVRMSTFAESWKVLFRTDYCCLCNITIEPQLFIVSWPYKLPPDCLCHLIHLVLKIHMLFCSLGILHFFQRLYLRLLKVLVLLVLMVKLARPLWGRNTSLTLPLLMRHD